MHNMCSERIPNASMSSSIMIIIHIIVLVVHTVRVYYCVHTVSLQDLSHVTVDIRALKYSNNEQDEQYKRNKRKNIT